MSLSPLARAVHRSSGRACVVAALLLIGACATPSRDATERAVQQRIDASVGVPPAGTGDAARVDAEVRELLGRSITSDNAVRIALLRNPRVAAHFAQLGISRAALIEASRIGNPELSAARITGDGERITTLGLTQSLSDLLLLSSRRRFAQGESARAEDLAVAAIAELAADVEVAWLDAVGAEQVARMRAAAGRAAQLSAELAERFFKAGNISELQLTLERAAAAQARVATLRATAEAGRLKLRLQQQMGLAGSPDWALVAQLAAPPAQEQALEPLLDLARQRRADLAAARRHGDLLADALAVARRWRWLGHVEVGVERERETDGARLSGPTLALALPIFSQGQAGIARAEAELAASRAALAELEAAIDHDVRLAAAAVAANRAIAEEFRASLVPQHELIVQRQQQRQNFMFIGQFELLYSKQQEYDAYQGYLEAVRDYWLARAALSRATGGRLSGDAGDAGPAIGVEAVLGTPDAPEPEQDKQP